MQIVTRLSNGNRQSRKTQGMSLKTGFYQEKCGRLKFLPKRQGENMTDRSAINGQITLGHFRFHNPGMHNFITFYTYLLLCTHSPRNRSTHSFFFQFTWGFPNGLPALPFILPRNSISYAILFSSTGIEKKRKENSYIYIPLTTKPISSPRKATGGMSNARSFWTHTIRNRITRE